MSYIFKFPNNKLKVIFMSNDPNDDRSDSMNPNNDAYSDSLDNHADQLNPNNDEYKGDEENADDDE